MFPRLAAAHKRQRSTRRPPGCDSRREAAQWGMDIHLNGEPRHLPAALTLQQLLEHEGLAERRVAIEVNGEIVPRSRHAECTLQAGDRVEIVHALGGG